MGIRVADRFAPIRQLGRLGSQRVGLGSRHQPLVMGGGCAVERSRGRSYLLLADDLEAAGLSSELPFKSLAASLSGLARLRSWLTAFVAVGLPLTRQRGNRPGFLPSE